MGCDFCGGRCSCCFGDWDLRQLLLPAYPALFPTRHPALKTQYWPDVPVPPAPT